MLTETDKNVMASINLHAVFGVLPRLVELLPEAREVLAPLTTPVTVTFSVVKGDSIRLVFHRDRIELGGEPVGVRVALVFRSADHLNAVADGTAQPIPLSGPRGLTFLVSRFTPLTRLLARYLKPTLDDLAEPVFAEASNLLALHVAAVAITVVANDDRSGRFSAQQMPDGELDISVGESLRYRIDIRDHRLQLTPVTARPPRATFGFADLTTVGDVLGGRESALACVCDGRIAMSGYIPLVDNTSRILNRVGQYLGK